MPWRPRTLTRSSKLLTALLQVLAIVSTTNLTFLRIIVIKIWGFFFCAIDGDTTCFQGAIASCVNGQFDTSQGLCPANQQCFALPSVDSNGTVSQIPNKYFSRGKFSVLLFIYYFTQTITCTSEKIALSLIEAAGATGGITGSGSGGSSTSPSSTSSGGTSTATSLNSSITSTSTALNDSVVTVTVTVQVLASSTTTLPTVTQTLSPEEASSLLSSLLAQGGPATTATSDALDVPSQTLSSTVSATATGSDNLPTATPDSNSPTSATNIPSSSASPDASGTPVDIANTTASPTGLGSASGGYSGY